MFREGLMVILSGPSGTGKGTLLKLLKEGNDSIKYSVSATTRKPRAGETDGQNYFFKTMEEFEKMIDHDELVEWVKYCDNYYGTPRAYVENQIKSGYDVILEIEVEGAVNIMKKYPHCVSIFVLPPSFEELRNRVVGRGTETMEVIEKRLETAKKEFSFVDRYDYVIVNDHLETGVEEIKCILMAEKLKYSRNNDVLKQIGFSHENC